MDRDIVPIAGEIILLAIGGALLLYRLGRPARRGRYIPMRLSILLIAFLLACIEVGLFVNSVQAAMLH